MAATLAACPPGLEALCGPETLCPIDPDSPPGTFLPPGLSLDLETNHKGDIAEIFALLARDLDKRIQRPPETVSDTECVDYAGVSEANGYSLFSGNGVTTAPSFDFVGFAPAAQKVTSRHLQEEPSKINLDGWDCSFPTAAYCPMDQEQPPSSPLSTIWTDFRQKDTREVNTPPLARSFLKESFLKTPSGMLGSDDGWANSIGNALHQPIEKAKPPGSPWSRSTACTTSSDPEVACTEMESFCLSGMPSKWHRSAKLVGDISEDGHVFTKVAGADKIRTTGYGNYQKLSSICMIYDQRLRCGGMHRYNYQVLSGEIGAADGAGFVFDSQVRRSNLQRMCSIFLNNRGQICFRNQQHVEKLSSTLPRMEVGTWLNLTVDLDNLYFHFMLCDPDGNVLGGADISLGHILSNAGMGTNWQNWQSGFFCAIVTKDISVFLE